MAKAKFSRSTTGPGGLLNTKRTYTIGPGEPPPGFVGPTTSKSEWWLYWASAKVFNDPKDPRQQPYWGGEAWGYQVAANGGRHVPGGAVVDFIYYLPGEVIGVRLQTYRYHETAGPTVTAYDRAQLASLARWMTIKDVFEQDIMQDSTGESACRRLVEVLGGKKRIGPAASGTTRRVRA